MIGSGLQGKNPVTKDGKTCTAPREQRLSVDQEEYYIPSVDLLTAQVPYIIEYFQYNQSSLWPNLVLNSSKHWSVSCVIPQDLLSFELLDINIVQELENVPNNTPAGKNSSCSCCLRIIHCLFSNVKSAIYALGLNMFKPEYWIYCSILSVKVPCLCMCASTCPSVFIWMNYINNDLKLKIKCFSRVYCMLFL